MPQTAHDGTALYETHFGIEKLTYSEWLTKCPSNIDEQQLDELLKKTYPEKFL